MITRYKKEGIGQTAMLVLTAILMSSLFLVSNCKPSPLKELGTVESFSLQDTKGNQIEWKQFRGEPVLVFFGYTYCPDFPDPHRM